VDATIASYPGSAGHHAVGWHWAGAGASHTPMSSTLITHAATKVPRTRGHPYQSPGDWWLSRQPVESGVVAGSKQMLLR
jgi:hypothetical protein